MNCRIGIGKRKLPAVLIGPRAVVDHRPREIFAPCYHCIKEQSFLNVDKHCQSVTEDSAALHIRTKFVIEELSVDEAMQMLEYKWIVPLVENINKLPEIIVADFIAKLESLCAKYETTFAEVEKEIAETEQTLIGLLDELEGDEFDMQGLAELKKLLGGE